MDSPFIRMGSRYMGPRPMDTKATWHSHGLGKPHMEISCALRLTLVNRIPTWEESRNIHMFMRIFPIKKHLPKQETKVGSTLL